MTSISGVFPNLIGGVSQQPPEIRAINTAEALWNSVSDVTVGLTTRNGAKLLSIIGNSQAAGKTIATHVIQKPRGDFMLMATDNDLYVLNLKTGVKETVVYDTPGARSYITADDSARDIGFFTVADTTFIYNRAVATQVTPTGETTFTGIDDNGTVRLNPNRLGTIWVRQRAGYEAHYTAYYKSTVVTSILSETDPPSTIATQMKDDFITAGLTDTTQPSSTVISIKFPDTTGYVEVQDDLANEALKSYNEYVDEFTDLPNFDRIGRLVEIRHDRADKGDDYWVIRKRGKWQETFGWNSYEAPNNATMPHILVDNKDGTWTLKQHTWSPRLCGDFGSNKRPSFFGGKINHMWVYKGRMGILSGENVIFSQVGKFENFYRSSCAQLLDDDRIDISSSSGSGASLFHVKNFNDALLVFSQFQQFIVAGDKDGILTPNNVNIKPVNTYRCSRLASPATSGPNVVFIDDFANKRFATVREYQTERVFGTQVAPAITDAIPEYIPTGVYKITESSSDNIMVLLSSGARNTLFLYNYYHNNEGKVQSSWQKWTLGCEIFNVEFCDDRLILIVNYCGKMMVLVVDFIMGAASVFDTEDILLDFKMPKSSLSVTYRSNGETVVQLPFSLSTEDEWAQYRLVISPTNSGDLPKSQTYRPKDREGDKLIFHNLFISGEDYVIGKSFEFQWKLNPIFYRDQNQVAIQDGQLMLRGVSFLFSNTGPFNVAVKPFLRETYNQKYSGIRVGIGESLINRFRLSDGEFRVSAYGQGAETDITVTARTPWRVRFSSVEWDGAVRTSRKRT